MLYEIVLHILLANGIVFVIFKTILGALFYDFLDFVHLSSVKKIRRRISFDPYPPDIVKHRNL